MISGAILSLYLSSLNEKERQAYEIAKLHLGSLFNVENTNGYIMWEKKRNSSKP